jgi:hypothetical protein
VALSASGTLDLARHAWWPDAAWRAARGLR